MTNRRQFIKGSIACALTAFLPELLPSEGIRLQTLQGAITIYRGHNVARAQEFNAWQAQQAAAMYFQQVQWVQAQQAMAQYQAMLAQQAVQNQWLNQQRIQALMGLARQFQNVSQEVEPWEYIQSAYGLGRTGQGENVMFGTNTRGRQVKVKSIAPEILAVKGVVESRLGEREAQTSAGPQSSDRRAVIHLPADQVLNARAVSTENGELKVSNEPVPTDLGFGRLAEFMTGQGLKYALV